MKKKLFTRLNNTVYNSIEVFFNKGKSMHLRVKKKKTSLKNKMYLLNESNSNE